MNILAIDTSFDACSAAIVSKDQTLWREQHIIGRGHSERLPLMIRDGLRATGLRADGFSRVGVVIGPGAFAGVRVGLAFARAFVLGSSAIAVGVTSLEALAAGLSVRRMKAAVAFDARRGQVYAGLFDADLRCLIEPFVAAPQDVAARIFASATRGSFILAGSGASLLQEFMQGVDIAEGRHIDPVALARRTVAAPEPTGPPAPLYLRPPDAVPGRPSVFDNLISQ